MQAKSVAQEGPAFVNAVNGLPLVLMSEGGSANEVWKSIELGAVEYLEKPLSQLKLRNIWQHVVRKVCQSYSLQNLAPQLQSAVYLPCIHPHGSICITAMIIVQMMQGNEAEGSSCRPPYKEGTATLPALPKQVCYCHNMQLCCCIVCRYLCF